MKIKTKAQRLLEEALEKRGIKPGDKPKVKSSVPKPRKEKK